MRLFITDIYSQREESFPFRTFTSRREGSSSDADGQTFFAKNVRIFKNYDVFTRGWVRGIRQCGQKGEKGPFLTILCGRHLIQHEFSTLRTIKICVYMVYVSVNLD